MKHRRFSNSPLLSPSVSVVVVVSSERRELIAIDPSTCAVYERTIAAMLTAAHIAEVPALILSRDALEQKSSSLATEPGSPFQYRFVLEENAPPWSHKPFVEMLTAQDRSMLVLAGFWLEHEVLTTALHALIDGYDVYVLLDATRARSRCASEAARERLSQAGAMPVTASQVINEWSFEAPDTSTRVALRPLLPVLLGLT